MFLVIFIAAVFLIFFRLGRQDIVSDDSHYSLRSFGYFDYMASFKQTTPIQWFGERPAWSYLSFHDHPPLYFFTQHIFFKVFGASVITSRLTSALAALGSIVVMFFLGRKLGGPRLGLLSMAALTLNNSFIWMGRIGHLESLFVFWLLLGLLFFIKGFEDQPRDFIWAGVFFGFSILSKYTLLFFLPALAIYLIWRRREVFRQKHFWLGILAFLVVASPLLIYNFSMLGSRGHFDVQFSDLFGQQHSDWTILQSRAGGWHFGFSESFAHMGRGMSWPYFGLVLAATAAALYWAKTRQKDWPYLVCLLFAVGFLCLAYVGGANRWLVVLSVFAALLLAYAFENLLRFRAVSWVGGAMALYFLVFIWNVNHALAANPGRFLASDLRLENYGYNQLDRKISSEFAGKIVPWRTREAVALLWFGGIQPTELPFYKKPADTPGFNPLVIYDSRMDWFPVVWTFGRARIYDGVPTITTIEFFRDIRSSPYAIELLNSLGFSEIYYVHSSDRIGTPGSGADERARSAILESFEKKDAAPDIIYDDQGREAFYIFKSQTLDL